MFDAFVFRYKMNLAFDELKEQWRVEKAALELAGAQTDIQEVSSYEMMKCITSDYRSAFFEHRHRSSMRFYPTPATADRQLPPWAGLGFG